MPKCDSIFSCIFRVKHGPKYYAKMTVKTSESKSLFSATLAFLKGQIYCSTNIVWLEGHNDTHRGSPRGTQSVMYGIEATYRVSESRDYTHDVSTTGFPLAAKFRKSARTNFFFPWVSQMIEHILRFFSWWREKALSQRCKKGHKPKDPQKNQSFFFKREKIVHNVAYDWFK